MGTRDRWMRWLGEGALIVISILLAFAIDAWWDGRQEANQRNELLQALHDDFSATSELLADAIRSAEAIRERSATYLQVVEEGEDIPVDSLRRLYRSISQGTPFEARVGSYQAALTTGGIELARNPSLMNALNEFDQALDLHEIHWELLGEIYYVGAVQDLRNVVGSSRAPSAPSGSPIRRLLPDDFDLRSRAAYAAMEPVAGIHLNQLRALRDMKQAADAVVLSIDTLMGGSR